VPDHPRARGPRWALALGALGPAVALAAACSGNELKLRGRVDPGAVLSRVTAVATARALTSAAPAAIARTPAPVADRPARLVDTAPPVAETVPPVADTAPSVADTAASVADTAPSIADDDTAPALELIGTARETLVYAEPSRRANKVGSLRLGARVRRSRSAVGYEGCALGWYRIAPFGFVCVGNAASLEIEPALGELLRTRPDRNAALPYAYGRSRPVPPPLYTRLPTREETLALEGPSRRTASGFLDLLPRPLPDALAAGQPLPVPFGYARPDPLTTPRALPNSAFALLEVLEHDGRRFGVTTDLELVPLDRLTRVEPSAFHGVVLDAAMALPLVFVRGRHAALYAGSPTRGLRPLRALGYREAVPVTDQSVESGGLRYLETRDGNWIRDTDLVRIGARPTLPAGVREGRTWIHVSVVDQTLVAYVGAQPVYATLVSTGAGGMGDPETTHATPRGEFLIHTKHVTATMNGDELGDEFDLRDVPYVEYFTQGYAFHAAFWHDAFGTAHSHGCVNLSPLDARWLFHFTEPAVPQGWHAAFSREGTLVSITP
jgi:hypothetical protein